VRLVLAPPRKILAIGTRLVSDDTTLSPSPPGGVSASPIVNASGPTTLSSFVTTLGISLLIGKPLTVRTTNAVLLVGFGSGMLAETLAKLVFVPGLAATT